MLFSTPKFYLLVFCSFLLIHQVSAQVTISGTVYDITKRTPIEAVSVISTGGNGTVSDASGKYHISVKETDSIYFSYQNKATPKYAVTAIANTFAFDISIMIKVAELPSIFLKPRSYILDSLQNRKDYARIFNYKKPGLKTSLNASPGGVAAGLDLNELIGMFNFAKIRRTISFQNRLLQEEQEKYINHRYSKALVRRLTGLTPPELDVFMAKYKPAYQLVLKLNELELGKYILDSYKLYRKAATP